MANIFLCVLLHLCCGRAGRNGTESFIFLESLSVSHFCNASGGRTTSDARDVKYTYF